MGRRRNRKKKNQHQLCLTPYDGLVDVELQLSKIEEMKKLQDTRFNSEAAETQSTKSRRSQNTKEMSQQEDLGFPTLEQSVGKLSLRVTENVKFNDKPQSNTMDAHIAAVSSPSFKKQTSSESSSYCFPKSSEYKPYTPSKEQEPMDKPSIKVDSGLRRAIFERNISFKCNPKDATIRSMCSRVIPTGTVCLPESWEEEDNSHLDNRQFTKAIQEKVRSCEGKSKLFNSKYLNWKIKRQDTLRQLQDLKQKVHDYQLAFNRTNYVFKNMNYGARMTKIHETRIGMSFLASVATVASGAASGLVSLAQACNIDSYTSAFNEIMEKDASCTKSFYETRSQCLAEYANVEEIVRKYHYETFGSTLGNIADTLKLGDLWSDLKCAYDKEDYSSVFTSIQDFFSKNATSKVLGEVSDSLSEYADINPATVESCKTAGKTAIDYFDLWLQKANIGKQGLAVRAVSQVSNQLVLFEDRRELDELSDRIGYSYEPQSKLESEIEVAIDSLALEYKEIRKEFDCFHQ